MWWTLLSLFILGPICGVVAWFVGAFAVLIVDLIVVSIWPRNTNFSMTKKQDYIFAGGTALLGMAVAIEVLSWFAGAVLTVSATVWIPVLLGALVLHNEPEARARLKAAWRAALQSIIYGASDTPADGSVQATTGQPSVLDRLESQQREVDALAEWVSLPEADRKERVRLIGSIGTTADTLTGQADELRRQRAERDEIALHAEGLKRHQIPQDLTAKLDETVATRNEAVEQRQQSVDQTSGALVSLTGELEAHRAKPRPTLPSVDEVIAQARAAELEAQQVLSAQTQSAEPEAQQALSARTQS